MTLQACDCALRLPELKLKPDNRAATRFAGFRISSALIMASFSDLRVACYTCFSKMYL